VSKSEYVIEFPPGSRIATEAGCTCPVIDNCYGKGFRQDASGQPMYWMSTNCPIHGHRKDNADGIPPRSPVE